MGIRTEKDIITSAIKNDYRYGFAAKIKQSIIKNGLSPQVIRLISRNNQEPKWLLDWRLAAYRQWQKMVEPHWANINYPPIDYQAISYFAGLSRDLRGHNKLAPEIAQTFEQLGISLNEQQRLSGAAVDAVLDSVSVITTYQRQLAKKGIIFCSMNQAVHDYPRLVKKYLGKLVPPSDNFFAALNSAVFSDGSFIYVPKGVRCPMDLSTYFRINAAKVGQFERTLIIAEPGSYVNYLEGCTARIRDENQLHAAVVEIFAAAGAEVNYSTVQNWYPGDQRGRGGIYNFVTKRGLCEKQAKLSWTQVETGSAITWKYPSVILKGDNSIGEFYSVAVTNNYQQADTGTKMIHLGKNTKSRIVAKSIAAGRSRSSYRGLVKIAPAAGRARNYSQCDSLLLGGQCQAHTFPNMEIKNKTARVEHEATAAKIETEQLLYLKQRGLNNERAVNLIVDGFASAVMERLPLEFAVEAKNLLELNLDNAVG